jgi:hypothetical protein
MRFAAIYVLSIGGQAKDDVVSVTPLLALELLLACCNILGTFRVFFDLRELLSYKRVNDIYRDLKVNHLLEDSV